MNMTPAYLVVEGVIGVGKTTLARMFQKESGAQLVLEVFEENPFLSDFYGDRARYAFQTQIFFLLSRYQQQRQLVAVPPPIISDYMFDKDRLFAQVNLQGDELDTYYSVQEALAENVRVPDLIVYLRASTDTLLNRITARDRPYERNMDPHYIDSLRAAYEQFFATYTAAPVLVVDTNDIDFVQHRDDREAIFDRMRGALGEGPRQPVLPGLGPVEPTVVVANGERVALDKTARRLGDFQQFHRQLDRDKGFFTDPHFNMLRLQEEVGELSRAFALRWRAAAQNHGQPSVEASRAAIQEELADVLAYVIKLANYMEVDLETAYLDKMRTNVTRDWDMAGATEESDE
jgi:deoxyguanosine kinase